MFVYYVFVVVLILIGFAQGLRVADDKYTAIVEYFQCEAKGRNNNCTYAPPLYPTILLIVNILLGLFPAITLVFAVNVSDIKAVSKYITKKLSKTLTISSTVNADSTTAL